MTRYILGPGITGPIKMSGAKPVKISRIEKGRTQMKSKGHDPIISEPPQPSQDQKRGFGNCFNLSNVCSM